MQMIKILPALMLVILFNSISGQLALDPKSIGTAGTFATQSRGDEAIGWNPANLALSDNPRFGLRFGVLPLVPIPSLQLNNDAFTVNWFNDWFTKGEYLDSHDKAELLSAFPGRGLRFSPLVSMKLIGMNFGPFALSITPEIHTNLVLPKGLFEFVLYGNEFARPVDLSDIKLQAQSVVPISFGYGVKLPQYWADEFLEGLYAGVAVKLLAGITYAGIEDISGGITTYKDKVAAEGVVKGKYAVGGFGTAFDIGVAADINSDMRLNLALNNLVGFINWSETNASEIVTSFEGELFSSEFENLADYSSEQIDSLFNITDTTYSIDKFSSKYPSYLLAGFEYRNILPSLDLFINYRQDLSDEFYFDMTPRISSAIESSSLPWLPLRAGLSVGGSEGFQWGAGFGLHLGHYKLDIGFSQNGGVFNQANGFAFSIGQQLIF